MSGGGSEIEGGGRGVSVVSGDRRQRGKAISNYARREVRVSSRENNEKPLKLHRQWRKLNPRIHIIVVIIIMVRIAEDCRHQLISLNRRWIRVYSIVHRLRVDSFCRRDDVLGDGCASCIYICV